MKKTLKNIVMGTALVGALFAIECREEDTPQKYMVNSNHMDFSGHASKETFTDLDYDGKFDLYVAHTRGQKDKIIIKKGYNLGGPTLVEPEYVDASYFEKYDAMRLEEMAKDFYRLEERK